MAAVRYHLILILATSHVGSTEVVHMRNINLTRSPNPWMVLPETEMIATEEIIKNASYAFFPPSESDLEDKIVFHLYTRNMPNGKCFSRSTVDNIVHLIDFSKDIKSITHGFLSSGHGDTCQQLKDVYLEHKDVNVIILNWEKVAENIIYYATAECTRPVGGIYAKILNRLIEKGANASRIHLIGHSLGAHVSGYAGRAVTEGRLGRITGLDPAYPLFVGTHLVPLSASDAEFVDVIHTCAHVLGYPHKSGHADFYPNGGGVPQPGCFGLPKIIEACSHGRSWMYFAESINPSNKFVAKMCNSWEDYKSGQCYNGTELMGEPTLSSTRGSFYLETLPEPPYILN